MEEVFYGQKYTDAEKKSWLKPRLWTELDLNEGGKDGGVLFDDNIDDDFVRVYDEKIVESRADDIADGKVAMNWTTAPLSVRERFKQWGPIKDYETYLKTMRKMGSTTAYSKAAFEEEKIRVLDGIFHDYHENLPNLDLDLPNIVFDKDHTLRGDGELLERVPTEATRFEKDFMKKEWIDLQSETDAYAWPNLADVPTDVIVDGEDAPEPTTLDTVVLRTWRTVNMKRGGRRRMMNALALVGNRNGVAGFAIGKADEAARAMDKAVSRAAKHMIHIPRRDGHTLYENVQVKSIKTRIYMQHAPEDHGVVAHFIIQDIARLAGIRNMIASVKGNVNQINIVRGVFQGLLMQQDHVAKMKDAGVSLIEYNSKDGRPVVHNRAAPEEITMEDLGRALRQRLPMSRAEVRTLTIKWMVTFPNRPTTQNFEVARLINHGLLLEQCLLVCKQEVPEALVEANIYAIQHHPELVQWLKEMPEEADPSNSMLYPAVAETMYNCIDYPDYQFDDDCYYYYDELVAVSNNHLLSMQM